MAPIRVALIGLSSTAKTSWAEQGHLPYLLTSRGKIHYEIVALLNSSVAAAEAARVHFKLPASVKTYGDPEKLAADDEIDLVVCNTRVDTHVATTLASLRAGKGVYVEWPLAANYEGAATVADFATGPGHRLDNSVGIYSVPELTYRQIGLQGRVAPVPLKIRELLGSGRIGRVLSSDLHIFGSLYPRAAVLESLKYFTDRQVGGNTITISLAHTIDYVHDILGEFETFQSRMQIQRPALDVLGAADGSEGARVRSDVPDLLVVHGKLAKGKADIVDDATLSVTYRSGPQFKGTPGLTWTINGEKGEIRVTAAAGYLQFHSDGDEPDEIKVHDHPTDEVIDVAWDWANWQKELPLRARIVAEMYERYARWWEAGKPAGRLPEGQEFPRLHDAVVRMKQLDEIFRQFDAQQ